MKTNLETIALLDLDHVHGGLFGRRDDQMVPGYQNVMTPAQAKHEFPGNKNLQNYYSNMHEFFNTPNPDAVHNYDANGVSIPGPARR